MVTQKSLQHNGFASWHHNGPYYDLTKGIMTSHGLHYGVVMMKLVLQLDVFTVMLKIKYTSRYLFFSYILLWNYIKLLKCMI